MAARAEGRRAPEIGSQQASSLDQNGGTSRRVMAEAEGSKHPKAGTHQISNMSPNPPRGASSRA